MAHKEKRKDVRIYLKVEECEHLKAVAKESGISLSDLIGKTVMRKFPLPKVKTERQKNTVLCEATVSEGPSPAETPEADRKQMARRLIEVNTILKQAYDGNTLPSDEYHRLKNEQKELRAILGHN